MSGSFGGVAYVSYARADEISDQVITQLKDSFESQWVDIYVDVDQIEARQSFDKFINEIGEADCVIAIFSEAYFQSFYCMLELASVLEQGNVLNRIYPIISGANFRFDGSQRHWFEHWEKIFDTWHGDTQELLEDKATIYGSQAECDLILKHLAGSITSLDNAGSLFSFFGRRVAGSIPDSNEGIIDWIKESYFERVKSSPVFSMARTHLSQCSDKTKNTLSQRVPSDIRSDVSEQIAYLTKLPIPELIGIFKSANAQIIDDQLSDEHTKECHSELSKLLKLLLPSLFSPAYIPKLRKQCNGTGIIEIPYATSLSAEILMAGVDERVAEFIIKSRDGLSSRKQLLPGNQRVRLPPESGAGSPVQDVDDHLASQLGLASKSVETVFAACEEHLFKLPEKEAGRAYQEERMRRMTQRELKRMKEDSEPRYYWVFVMGSSVSRKRWEDIASHISTHYPEIVLLMLEDDEYKEDNERDLFRHLHGIITDENKSSNFI